MEIEELKILVDTLDGINQTIYCLKDRDLVYEFMDSINFFIEKQKRIVEEIEKKLIKRD